MLRAGESAILSGSATQGLRLIRKPLSNTAHPSSMTIAREFSTLLDHVHEQLASSSFREQASNFDRRPLIHRANSLGGPRMKLIHWKRLLELGRIPHSKEGHAVEAIAGINQFGAPKVEIIMVSHRWLRPSLDSSKAHPDLLDNKKANAINEFSRWRREWVFNKHGFLPEIYYWIDYPCIDQTDTSLAVPLLPMWVACCERFLRIDTEGYDSRAWCRLEPLLSYVYSFADHHLSIDLEYKSRWPDTGIVNQKPLLDPNEGDSTFPTDRELIASLTSLALAMEPANRSRSAVQFDATTVRCFKL